MRSALARATAPAASPTRSPKATTDGPWTIWCECASPSGSVLTTRLIAPCVQRVTCFERWRPVSTKPMRREKRHERLRIVLGDGELHPFDPSGTTRDGKPPGMHPVVEPDQRPLAVLGDPPRRGHAEAVVKDLVASQPS